MGEGTNWDIKNFFSVSIFPDYYVTISPTREDHLIFTSFASVLKKIMYAAFGNKLNNEKSFGLRPEVGMVDYYSEVVSWGRVDKLIYLNFLPLLHWSTISFIWFFFFDRRKIRDRFTISFPISSNSWYKWKRLVQRNWWNTNVLLFTEQFAQQSCHASLWSNFSFPIKDSLDIYMKHSCRLLKKSHSPLSICCLF